MSKKWDNLPSWVKAKIVKSKQAKQTFGYLSDEQLLFEQSQREMLARDIAASSKSRSSSLDSLSDAAFALLLDSVGKKGLRVKKKKVSTKLPSTRI